jgi:hypothetical protein
MTFDVHSFLDAAVSGANDTKIVPCPAGEFRAIITKVEARTWASKDGSKSGIALDVSWDIEDPEVRQRLNRTEVIVRQGIMLDITPDNRIDTGVGKNVSLGRLREAVNMNDPSQPFSFNMLPGQMAVVTVTHRPDDRNPGDSFAEIRSVARLG